MSKTFSPAFTNTVSGSKTVTLKTIGLKTNYALQTEQPGTYSLVNNTGNGPASEQYSVVRSVVANPSTELTASSPMDNHRCVRLEVRDEMRFEVTDTVDATYSRDSIAVAAIKFWVPEEMISDGNSELLAQRIISMLYDNGGVTRLTKMLKNALQVTAD